MTVSYNQLIHSGTGSTLKLLGIWRASLYKTISHSLIIYLVLYFVISFIYRFGLSQNELAKTAFERLAVSFETMKGMIPLVFLLGFYVSQVVTDWWKQLTYIAWVDNVAMYVAAYLPGKQNMLLRRTLVRWANLCNVIVLMGISQRVSDRFPTYEHLVEAKLLTVDEMRKLREVHTTVDCKHHLTYLPIAWAQAAIRRAHSDGIIDTYQSIELIKEYQILCGVNGNLIIYGNWIPIPIAYTQVVLVAVYSYFGIGLIAHQFLHPTLYLESDSEPSGMRVLDEYNMTSLQRYNAINLVGYDHTQPDIYVPVFLILEFLFFYGWFKVALELICPFGNDDDDFDVNYISDRNVLISHLMIDTDDHDTMELEDTWEGTRAPLELPHTEDSLPDGAFRTQPDGPIHSQMTLSKKRRRKESTPAFNHRYPSVRNSIRQRLRKSQAAPLPDFGPHNGQDNRGMEI